jgi:2-hydroxychromene-2-carboxylate isomerase
VSPLENHSLKPLDEEIRDLNFSELRDPSKLFSRLGPLQSLGKIEDYSRSLFAAMFQDSLSEIDRRECIIRAEACGISAIDFQVALEAQETTDRLNATIKTAFHAGVFGVPAFMALGELFWGNDRIILLRHFLGSHQSAI